MKKSARWARSCVLPLPTTRWAGPSVLPLAVSLCLTILLFAIGSAGATELRVGEGTISVAEDEVISDDLLAFANRVVIDGVVEGDLITAASKVTVDGEVKGSVLALGQSVTLAGKVGSSARLAGEDVTIMGEVGRNLAAAGSEVYLDKTASVGNDAHLAGAILEVDGQIDRNADVASNKLTILGSVAGRVKAEATKLSLGPDADIGGNLTYRSPEEITVPEGARVGGKIKHLLPREKAEPEPKSPFGFWWALFRGLAVFVTGVVLLALFRGHMINAVNAVSQPAWKSLLFGFLILVVTPVATIILCITLIGIPLGILLCLGYVAALLLSGIPVSISIGRWLLRSLQRGRSVSPYLALFIGVIILGLLMHIPYAGWIVRFVVVLFGLGALSRAAKGMLMGRASA
ncbi:MAG: hypothetical protein GTO55_09005 [Armatimonadetes bacterium]|nr:hypothetical protein [Armatimonadota bacterium]NIM24386.1 hypothetical protein [Armatimonadota bacterium]NIM68255.1 hypothetical protein [Armatimonadota bacterium]NIM75156.1 hypothetical protein [Armatimonadota bacterium]NIN06460.1 hypothetical protein [Armatimonadota bacterium]